MVKHYYLKYPWGSSWCGMLLFAGKKNILVDSAVEEAFSPFLKNSLAELHLKIEDIDLVVNTHGHADHTGMNELIRANSHAGILNCSNLPENYIIDGGDYQLQILHTPGHTGDSVSFLELSEGILFSGDAIEGSGSRFAGVALYENAGKLLATIEKIRTLYTQNKIQKIYLGHAYHGTCGILEKDEIIPFLELSRKMVLSYDSFIKGLSVNLTLAEQAELLRQEFSVSESVLCEKSAEITVKAHINRGEQLC